MAHPDSDAELKMRSRKGRQGKGRAHAEKKLVSTAPHRTAPRNRGIKSSGPRRGGPVMKCLEANKQQHSKARATKRFTHGVERPAGLEHSLRGGSLAGPCVVHEAEDGSSNVFWRSLLGSRRRGGRGSRLWCARRYKDLRHDGESVPNIWEMCLRHDPAATRAAHCGCHGLFFIAVISGPGACISRQKWDAI